MRKNVKIKYGGLHIKTPGFEITRIAGRDTQTQEHTSESVPILDGDFVFSERMPGRTITVDFMPVFANTSDKRIDRLDTIRGMLLRREEQELIFDDEPDRFYKAYVESVTGNQIVFYCPDPYKYSTVEKVFTARGDTMMVHSNGTAPSDITYTIDMPSENGFIGIVSKEGVMEFGHKTVANVDDEFDSEIMNMSTLANAVHDSGGTEWLHPTYGTTGRMERRNIVQPNDPEWAKFSREYMTITDAGSQTGGCNGPLKTISVPEPCTNFYANFMLLFWAEYMGQTGEISLTFLTADNKIIMAINLWKTDTSGNTYYYDLCTYAADGNDHRILKRYSMKASHYPEENKFFGDWGHCDMYREGTKLQFYFDNTHPTFNVPEIANFKLSKVQLSIRHAKGRSGRNACRWLGIGEFTLRNRDHVTQKPQPANRFLPGKYVVNGTEGMFYINGKRSPENEIVGTQYFKIPPGDTEIKFMWSDFVQGTPTITATVREAWL